MNETTGCGLDFKARITGDTVTFDDPDFHGISYLVEGRLTVFPYHWKSNPSREIVEIITLATDNYRTHLWQTFDDGATQRQSPTSHARRCTKTFGPRSRGQLRPLCLNPCRLNRSRPRRAG